MKDSYSIIINEILTLYKTLRIQQIGTVNYYKEIIIDTLMKNTNYSIIPDTLINQINLSITPYSNEEHIAEAIVEICNAAKPWKPGEQLSEKEFPLDYNNMILLIQNIQNRLNKTQYSC